MILRYTSSESSKGIPTEGELSFYWTLTLLSVRINFSSNIEFVIKETIVSNDNYGSEDTDLSQTYSVVKLVFRYNWIRFESKQITGKRNSHFICFSIVFVLLPLLLWEMRDFSSFCSLIRTDTQRDHLFDNKEVNLLRIQCL